MVKINNSFIKKKEKKILKQKFNIKNIEKIYKKIQKNYPDFVKINFMNIYFALIYYDEETNKINVLIKIKNILILLKNIFFNTFKKKHFSENKFLIFSKHKYIDQLNFSLISNYLKKKNFKHDVLIGDQKSKKLLEIKSLYNQRVSSMGDFLTINAFLNANINYLKSKKIINQLIIDLNCSEISESIKNIFLNFFLKLEMFKEFLKKKKLKNMLISYYSEDVALLYYLKFIEKKKINTLGYALNGTGGDTARYSFHDIDLLFVPGSIDNEILKKIKRHKLSFMSLPKKTILSGNIRSDYFDKKNIKKEKKIFKILFIKSNDIYLKGVDDVALNIFIKSVKDIKNLKILIKDRPVSFSKEIKRLLSLKKISRSEISKERFIERDILSADLCVGTNSTALVRQAINFDKPIIQLFADKHYMYDFSDHVLSVNNEKDLKKIILKLKDNKKFYNNYTKKISKYRKKILFQKGNTTNLIYKKIKNLQF